MRLSDQQLQVERLWASAIRQTRRAVQIPERELHQEEKHLRVELAKLRHSLCAAAAIREIEKRLHEKESGVQSKLSKQEIAFGYANLDLKMRGLDALTQENNAFWQEVATSLDTLAHALKSQGEQFPGDAHKADSKRDWSLLPESNFDRLDAISRVTGRDTDIDLLLRSLGNVLRDYEQRKRRRRIAFLGARVLIFLGLVFLADYALGFVEPLPFYLLAAACAWFLDEYLIRPALDKRFEVWNVRVLEQTITDFYRAQRRLLYLTALLETRMHAAAAVLETAQT